jgi:hypothetical protein
MNIILKDVAAFCRNYFDDLIIFSKNLNDHINHLKTIIQILTDNNFTINVEKCKIGCISVNLLGHIISINGSINLDKRKLENIKYWKRPKTGKEIQRILGFLNYFRRYFILEPFADEFNKLRNTKKIQWSDKLERSWNLLINNILNSNKLDLPNYQYPINIGIDASRVGLGMVMWQDIPMDQTNTGEIKYNNNDHKYNNIESANTNNTNNNNTTNNNNNNNIVMNKII